jgi:hypothetical protein
MERLADEAAAVLGDMRFAERLEVASALKSPVREFVRGAISHCSKSIW